MNELNKVYRIWVQLTVSLALVSLLAVGTVFYNRISSVTSDSRHLHEAVLIETLKKDLPRIAEELYLHLDTLESRKLALQNLLPGNEDVELTYQKVDSLNTMASRLKNSVVVDSNSDTTTASVAINFEDIPLGNLILKLKYRGTSLFSEIAETKLVAWIIGFCVFWFAALWTVKHRVLVPLGVTLKEEFESRALSQVAQQVAHDIRSPLTALNMLADRSSELRDEHRHLARMAIQRINDIAQALKDKSLKKTLDLGTGGVKPPLIIDLNNSLSNLVREKMMEIGGRDVQIYLDQAEDTFGLFLTFDREDFNRIISNVINNSIDAIETHGTIKIATSYGNGFGCIHIADNGRGIPRSVLSKVGRRGFSFGKSEICESGFGLGLSSAIEILKLNGGDFNITSTVGVGTTVLIRIPVAKTPGVLQKWLSVKSGTSIVVLDDDRSVHEVWRQKLQSTVSSVADVSITFCTNAGEVAELSRKLRKDEALYLIDFELSDGEPTGLDLIAELGIARNSILVTSRSDQQQIEVTCAIRGIKLLPKSWISTVPVRTSSRVMA